MEAGASKLNLKQKATLTLTFLLLLACYSFSFVKADTVTTIEDFNLSFLDGEAFAYQDLTNSIVITFTVSDSNLTGTGNLATTDNGGTLTITPVETGNLIVTASTTNFTLYLNGVKYIGSLIDYAATTPFIISWDYLNTTISRTSILNISPFWQYFFQGDILGYFQAIFTLNFLIQDLLYGVIIMLFLVPIYVKTQKLWLLCVLWILLGSFFIVAVPSAGVLGIVFLVLGVASVIWKLVHPN